MATISGQGAASSPAVEDLVSSEDRDDLRICRPKSNGRSFVWTEKLFLLNKQGGAVCVVYTSVVATTCGNTSNLIAHYNSPSVEDGDAHREKLEEAMAARKTAGKGGARQPTLDSFTQ